MGKLAGTRTAVTRRSAFLLGGLLAAIIAMGFMPWHVARTTLDKRILSSVQKTTGMQASAAPGIHLALLPLPRVVVTDAVLTHVDGGLTVTAPRLRADVRILPLLGGHIELDTIDLLAPQVTLQARPDAASMAGWLAPLGAAWGSAATAPRLVIRQGSLFLRDALSTVSTIRDINLVIAARDGDDPVAIAGSLRWRGEFAEINAEWPMPQFTKAPGQRASASIKSAILTARFAGERLSSTPDAITGTIELDTPALGQALALTGETGLLAAVADRLRASGTISWNGQELTAPMLSLNLDGEKLDGAMSLRPGPDGRWALSGTFAGAQLDLDRMVRRADLGRYIGQGDRARGALDLGSISERNIDLRLSIDSARLAQMKLTGLALQLMALNDRIDLNLVQAGAYKGSIKARLALGNMPQGSGIEMKLGGTFERIDLAAAMSEMGEGRRLSGSAFGQWNAEGTGLNILEATENLKGRANLLVRQGEIGGIALGDLARRAERQPLSALREFRNGRTAFDLASLSGLITQGTLDLADSQMTGPGYRLNLMGKIALAERRLNLAGTLTGSNNGLQIPFVINGHWSDPLVTPDADALIRRSGAAAPLFQVQ